MMPVHPSRGELEAFERGRLHSAQWRRIERHVAECDTCCRLLEETPDDALVNLLKTAGEPSLSATVTDRPYALETPAAPAPRPPSRSSEPPPDLRDHPRYHVLEVLGSGGMGTVFKAEHRLMRRIVALKVIRADLLATPGGIERFQQEARAAALLSHPNIATAHDADQAGNTHFLIMEYAEGQTLDKVLERRGPLPWPEACGLICQVARGLQHACERDMVHRDLKPANLLLTPQGQIKILDFGLARLVSESPRGTVTPAGAVVGTPQYLAPEQARDPQSADIRADLYSLGCTWYEMLTGQSPFPEGTLFQQLLAHQDQFVRPLSEFRADLPPQLAAILHRLLEKDPSKRWQTPVELLKALEPWTSPALRQAAAPGRPPMVSRFGDQKIIALLLCGLSLVSLVWAGRHWLAIAQHADEEGRPKAGIETAAPARAADDASPPAKNVADSQPTKEDAASASAQGVTWLRANNRFGTENQFVEDNGRKLNKSVIAGKVFVLQLAPTLMKSEQPTVLVGRQQDFFVFELPPAALPITGARAILTTSGEQDQAFQAPLSVHLSDLRIDQKEIDGTTLSGSVTYRTSAPVSGKLAMRLTLMLGKSTKTSYHILPKKDLSGEGAVRFRFESLYTEQAHPSGPVVCFIDLSAVDEPGSKANALVLSNGLAMMVVAQIATLPKSP